MNKLFMMNGNIPTYIKQVTSLKDISSCRLYLTIFTDYLFDLIISLKGRYYSSERMAESSVWVQMMFTNTIAFLKLLEGFPYKKGDIILNPIIDHRMVYTISRTMYENLIAFELIYVLPSSDDVKDLMYYLYTYAGYKEQLESLSCEFNAKEQENIRDLEESLNTAKAKVLENVCYNNLDKQNQAIITNALKHGKYCYVLQNDNTLRKLKWEEGMKTMGVQTDIFDSMYKYLSNLAHPSHWGQRQFEQSFERIQPEYIQLVCMATRYMITFLSFFVTDFIKIEPIAENVFRKQNYDNQQLMLLHNSMFRK